MKLHQKYQASHVAQQMIVLLEAEMKKKNIIVK